MSLPELPWGESQIAQILPHRPPFLLVDCVVEVAPDRQIIGEKAFGHGEGLIDTPNGDPMIPASFLMEALAQLGAILILMKEQHRGKLIYFMGIDKVRYRRPVLPGQTVRMDARVIRLRSRVGTLSGRAEVAGRRVADGTMHFALGGEP